MSNSEDEIRRLLQQSKADQGEVGAQQLGRMAGAMYTSMLAGGLPPPRHLLLACSCGSAFRRCAMACWRLPLAGGADE